MNCKQDNLQLAMKLAPELLVILKASREFIYTSIVNSRENCAETVLLSEIDSIIAKVEN